MRQHYRKRLRDGSHRTPAVFSSPTRHNEGYNKYTMKKDAICVLFLVTHRGFEPRTIALKVRCSTG